LTSSNEFVITFGSGLFFRNPNQERRQKWEKARANGRRPAATPERVWGSRARRRAVRAPRSSRLADSFQQGKALRSFFSFLYIVVVLTNSLRPCSGQTSF